MEHKAETDQERKERTGLSSLEIADREAAEAVEKRREALRMEGRTVPTTPNRITLESMKAKIDKVEYMWPSCIPHMTICVILLENGYALVGTSAPGDPENYNAELGQKFAYEDALRKMWPLEAYLMRERMML